jgi:crotonobetainyl-CoA:carnitine CoA-transferase CaiB-like acyl-CoA transferase
MFTLQEFRSDNPGALKGVRVIDLSRLVAGNTLTMALADLGAEVIKVEPPRGDNLREWRVRGISTAWKAYSRNKRSICLNLRQPEGMEILQKLLPSTHVLVESFRPGTLEKMGLAPADLLALYPRLIIARISGWGQNGPYADRPGFGTLVEGMSGFAAMNGFADREPVLPPIYLADMTAGLYGAIGVLAALRAVENGSGSGQVIDVSLLDSVFSILGPQAANFRLTGKVKPRTGSCSTNSAPRNIYKTNDGHWVSLSASTQAMTETLFHAIGRPELISDPRFLNNEARLRNVIELNHILAGHMASMTRDECLTHFQGAGVTIAPVYDMRQIEFDPHFIQRKIVVELPDDEMGTVPVHSISPRLSNTPGVFRNSAPHLGQDSETILEELGFSASSIESLKEKGVICNADSEYPAADAQ